MSISEKANVCKLGNPAFESARGMMDAFGLLFIAAALAAVGASSPFGKGEIGMEAVSRVPLALALDRDCGRWAQWTACSRNLCLGGSSMPGIRMRFRDNDLTKKYQEQLFDSGSDASSLSASASPPSSLRCFRLGVEKEPCLGVCSGTSPFPATAASTAPPSTTSRPGPVCEPSGFFPWGQCSATCGPGTQRRRAKGTWVLEVCRVQRGQRKCRFKRFRCKLPSLKEESRECVSASQPVCVPPATTQATADCPKRAYDQWGECSASCGEGYQTRKVRGYSEKYAEDVAPDVALLVERVPCQLPSAEREERRLCRRLPPCPARDAGDCVKGPLLDEWSECTATCGSAYQTRKHLGYREVARRQDVTHDVALEVERVPCVYYVHSRDCPSLPPCQEDI